MKLIEIKNICKNYNSNNVLNNISFDILRGEMISIVGKSGAGKSTLLHIMGGLEKPTRGEVKLLGDSISSMSDSNRTRLRRESLGFVYQFHHLLLEFLGFIDETG